MVSYTIILSLALYVILYIEIASKFLGLFKLFNYMLDMGWTCMTCILMLLEVVIVLIVFHVWNSKLKWKAQNHIVVKRFFSFFPRKEKKIWEITDSSWNLKHFDSFSAKLCVSTINISWGKCLHFHRRNLLVFSTSLFLLQLFPFFFF